MQSGRDRGTAAPAVLDASLALSFANTVACPECRVGDALASPRSFRAWLQAAHGLESDPLPLKALEDLRKFREELREILGARARNAPIPPSALRSLNEAARFSPVVPQLVSAGKGLRWAWSDPGPLALRWTGAVARSAVLLLGGEEPRKLKRCGMSTCLHFLLARSRNQRWCSSTGCGNRARVARHYRRTHDTGD